MEHSAACLQCLKRDRIERIEVGSTGGLRMSSRDTSTGVGDGGTNRQETAPCGRNKDPESTSWGGLGLHAMLALDPSFITPVLNLDPT